MHTCKYCNHSYPTEAKYWRTKHRCRNCYNIFNREHDSQRTANRKMKSEAEDPILIPPLTRAAVSCGSCRFVQTCRSNVFSGRQVLCAPVHESDILLEKAYQERRVSLCL